MLSSIDSIGQMVNDTVRQNWEGLTSAVERNISAVFDELRTGIEEQGGRLERMAEHPSQGDEERVGRLIELEAEVEAWADKEAA